MSTYILACVIAACVGARYYKNPKQRHPAAGALILAVTPAETLTKNPKNSIASGLKRPSLTMDVSICETGPFGTCIPHLVSKPYDKHLGDNDSRQAAIIAPMRYQRDRAAKLCCPATLTLEKAMAAPNPERQREARDKLRDLFAYLSSVFIIHYASESFNAGRRRGSPRVTVITVRNVASGETSVFSIYREAELAGLAPVQVLSRIDNLEYALLEKFFQFMTVNHNSRFVHWNMRDATFGFAAIEHRYRVLGGTPVSLAEPNKFDLARAFAEIYGSRYVNSPYLKGLASLNHLSQEGYLDGPHEAEAFEIGNYEAVQRSVLAKVNILFKVFHLAHDRTLKTNASWWALNRGRAREAWEMLEHNPVYALGAVVVTAFGIALKVLEFTGL